MTNQNASDQAPGPEVVADDNVHPIPGTPVAAPAQDRPGGAFANELDNLLTAARTFAEAFVRATLTKVENRIRSYLIR
jgi:hypothetical protein